MEGTARWEGKGQISALGNAVAWGYDQFNKIKDLPHEGGGLHGGVDISYEPAAASELSHWLFGNWKVITDPWFHTWWRCEQIIKYLWEISPSIRPIIPAFSTLFPPFPPIAGSRQTIYGLHRDCALSTLSSQRPTGVSCTQRNMSYQNASSNFCNFKYISCIYICQKAWEASTAEAGGKSGSRFCFTSQTLKCPISHLETCQNTFPNKQLFLLSEAPVGYLDIRWCRAYADVGCKGKNNISSTRSRGWEGLGTWQLLDAEPGDCKYRAGVHSGPGRRCGLITYTVLSCSYKDRGKGKANDTLSPCSCPLWAGLVRRNVPISSCQTYAANTAQARWGPVCKHG